MRKVIVAAVLVALTACSGAKKAEAPATTATSHDSMMTRDTTKHQ